MSNPPIFGTTIAVLSAFFLYYNAYGRYAAETHTYVLTCKIPRALLKQQPLEVIVPRQTTLENLTNKISINSSNAAVVTVNFLAATDSSRESFESRIRGNINDSIASAINKILAEERAILKNFDSLLRFSYYPIDERVIAEKVSADMLKFHQQVRRSRLTEEYAEILSELRCDSSLVPNRITVGEVLLTYTLLVLLSATVILNARQR